MLTVEKCDADLDRMVKVAQSVQQQQNDISTCVEDVVARQSSLIHESREYQARLRSVLKEAAT